MARKDQLRGLIRGSLAGVRPYTIDLRLVRSRLPIQEQGVIAVALGEYRLGWPDNATALLLRLSGERCVVVWVVVILLVHAVLAMVPAVIVAAGGDISGESTDCHPRDKASHHKSQVFGRHVPLDPLQVIKSLATGYHVEQVSVADYA